MEETTQMQTNEAVSRLNSRAGGFSFSILVIIYFAVSLIVSIIISAIASKAMADRGFATYNEALKFVQSSQVYVYINYLLSPLIILSGILVFFKFTKINIRQNIKTVFPVKCGYKYYIIALLLIFGLLFSLSWVNDVSVKFFSLFGYKQRETSSYFPDLTGGRVVLALLVIAVLPALFEELMFRGVLLNSCKSSTGGLRAIFLTGFCFSLFHGSPEQTVYQFIAGCAFAFIAVRSGSILPSMLMHFINNALIVIFQASGVFNEAGEMIISEAGHITLIVLSALSLIGAVVWLILDKKPFGKCEKGSVKEFFKYSSVGIAALALLWILSLFGVS